MRPARSTGRPRRRSSPGCGRRPSTLLVAVALISVVGATGTVPDPGQRAPGTVDLVSALERPSPRSSADAVPQPVVDVSTLPRSVPVRLRIPAIDVDSALADLGLADDGTLEVPDAGFPAGWYHGAPTPGELGPAIIVGHVDWAGSPAVFADLDRLRLGDAIAVARGDGSTATFRVTKVDRFPKGAFPTDAVYGDIDHAGLRLITCGGDFDRDARSYVDNVVVFAELISA